MNNITFDRTSLRISAMLLLVGQLLYIVVTHFHPGIGETASNHPAVFTEYATSGAWIAVHLSQVVARAIFLGGLLALFFVLDLQDITARWAGRFGAASTVAAFALYGALQAVDGIANKYADLAWMNASDTEKMARFASAEAVRWIEWGMRSYHNFTLGLALLLFAVAVLRTAWIQRPIGYLMALSGLTCLAQGWIVGIEGFSPMESALIVLTWVLSVIWVTWLVVVDGGFKIRSSDRPANESAG